ncbi:MAG TPA: PIG-L family deacetylase [Dehalococcoidia bacterium]|jgi:LmbE family N-acetylglucosaminyl deacetylase|nr:PIG-L family deacetylase [Dehalococcoidia bacterium]HIK88749.1 PIG-L family deacetylase [Dehalococcoidia bacterium]
MSSSGFIAQKILMVFAHADDETLLAGALIAKLVADGHEVSLLCLASGDDDRTERLRKACDDLGVMSVETLRYSEGVMWPDDVESRNDSSASVRLDPVLSLVPIDDLASRIGGRLTELNPDIVITHSAYGDYGHADHAATHSATVAAVAGSSEGDIRLYALDWPRRLIGLNARMLKLGGRDVRRMGPDGRFNFSMVLDRSSESYLSIKVSRYLKTRRNAACWYAKELSMGPLPMRLLERLPLWIQSTILGRARLTLVSAPEDFKSKGEL